MTQVQVSPGPTREWRLVLALRLVALVAAIAVAVWTSGRGLCGQGLMLSGSAFGLVVLLGVAVGVTVVRPAPQVGVRSASLAPRRVRDFLPRTTPIVVAQVVLTLLVLTVTTASASQDSSGHSRAVGCTNATVSQGHSPYPGAFYAAPLAVALLVVLAVGGLAARRVVLRPRGMARTEAGEDRLRRSSLDVVVAATGVAVGAPLAGMCVVAGGALHSVSTGRPTCAPGWWGDAGLALLALGLLSAGSVALLLGRLFLAPSPRA